MDVRMIGCPSVNTTKLIQNGSKTPPTVMNASETKMQFMTTRKISNVLGDRSLNEICEKVRLMIGNAAVKKNPHQLVW